MTAITSGRSELLDEAFPRGREFRVLSDSSVSLQEFGVLLPLGARGSHGVPDTRASIIDAR